MRSLALLEHSVIYVQNEGRGGNHSDVVHRPVHPGRLTMNSERSLDTLWTLSPMVFVLPAPGLWSCIGVQKVHTHSL